MDDLANLAAVGANALVEHLASDTWESAKLGIIALWRRVQPDRAEATANDLNQAHDDLATAQSSGSEASVRDAIQSEWNGRLRRLLALRPESAEDLQRLLDSNFGIITTHSKIAGNTSITLSATGSRKSQIYQVGQGDQHINEK